MDYNDYKVYGLSLFAYVFTYAHVEDILQIILLVITIVYTGFKTEELINKRKNRKDDNDSDVG